MVEGAEGVLLSEWLCEVVNEVLIKMFHAVAVGVWREVLRHMLTLWLHCTCDDGFSR